MEHMFLMKEKPTLFTVKDHSVSGESFELAPNKSYGYLETLPQPQEEKLSEYYKTEDYISHTDAKRNLLERVYHIVRTISLKRKLKLINSFKPEDRKLLDIGCGTGDFLQIAQENKWQVSGIEPNVKARHIANEKTNGAVFDTKDLPKFQNLRFDVITLWHVLEHLPNLQAQIEAFRSLLKEDGTLIIAVPNHQSYDANYYKSFWAAYDVPRHLWHFNQSSISKLFASEHMKVIKTLPMKFDAYYVSLLSEKYKSGFMNPLKAFWIGLKSNMRAKRSSEYSPLIYIIKNK